MARQLNIKKTSLPAFLAMAVSLGLTLSLTACENTLPGGSDSRNKNYYDSEKTLETWVSDLVPGMSKAEVFARLGRTEADFTKLDRNNIVAILFGSRTGGIPVQWQTSEDIQSFLNELEGYQMEYRNVKRKHGLTSPIRIQTNSTGFEYTLNMIFKNGLLYEKPQLIGGLVTSLNSKTIFDYLNPGTFINKAVE